MIDYPYVNEITRLTIILGIVISILVYKYTGNTMVGLLIPGYLTLYVGHPLHILATAIIACMSFYIVHRVLTKKYILNGHRLFEVELIISLLIQILWNAIIMLLSGKSYAWASLYGIGYVIPGLITHEMGRQGPGKTLFSALTSTFLVFMIITSLAAVIGVLPKELAMINQSVLIRAQPYPYTYPVTLIPFAIVISVMADMLISQKIKIRPGGFVTAAYFALFLMQPLNILFVLAGTLITYAFIKAVANNLVLAFGRIRFGLIILSAVIITWLLEILLINLSQGMYIPWSGFVIIMPMLVALLTNSFDNQGIPKTFASLTLNTGIVWLFMMGMQWILRQLNLLAFFVK